MDEEDYQLKESPTHKSVVIRDRTYFIQDEVYELLGIKPRKQHSLKGDDSGSESGGVNSSDIENGDVEVSEEVKVEGETGWFEGLNWQKLSVC